ncbi:MAG: hypothetical protein WCB79_06025 [Halobacteriota archaeon]
MYEECLRAGTNRDVVRERLETGEEVRRIDQYWGAFMPALTERA